VPRVQVVCLTGAGATARGHPRRSRPDPRRGGPGRRRGAVLRRPRTRARCWLLSLRRRHLLRRPRRHGGRQCRPTWRAAPPVAGEVSRCLRIASSRAA
jgi:hypothetical protein